MPLIIPPELKKITPYVRRAEELDRDKANPESRLVSFYCRQYAVHTGISLATAAESKSCLGILLGDLEGEKQAMDSFTRDESKFLCTKFAEKIFDKADSEDRAGGANKNTARTFYAAASFFEIIQQFYNDDDKSEEVAEQKKKSVYCKWKATEILKAIKEGRVPFPGGYEKGGIDNDNNENERRQGQDEEDSGKGKLPFVVETVNEDNESEDDDEKKEDVIPISKSNVDSNDAIDEISDEGTEVQLPPPAYPVGNDTIEFPTIPLVQPPVMNIPKPPMAPVMNIPKPPMAFNPLPPAPPSIDTIPPAVPTGRLNPPSPPSLSSFSSASSSKKKSSFLGGFMGGSRQNTKIGKLDVADATELTRFALSALEDKDTDLAAERLQQALELLGRR